MAAKANALGRPSIGLATQMGYWIGHRQADLLALTWDALLEAQEVETRKTGVVLAVDARLTLSCVPRSMRPRRGPASPQRQDLSVQRRRRSW